MASLREPIPRPARAARGVAVRNAFWVIALAVIAAYAFFVALGAYSPGDVLGVTIVVAVLVLLWLGHAWAQGHHAHRRDSA